MGRLPGSKAKVITDKILMVGDEPRRSDGTFLPGRDSAVGKRFVYTPEDKAFLKPLFVEAFAEHDSLAKACSVVGISRRTIMDWRKEDNEFNEALIDAHDDSTDEIEGTLKDVAKNGKNEGARVTAATVYLNAHRPSLYRGTRRDGGDEADAKPEIHIHFAERPQQGAIAPPADLTIEAKPLEEE